MSEVSQDSIEVVKGTYLPSIDCTDLPYGFIPFGEEITESTAVPDYPTSAPSPVNGLRACHCTTMSLLRYSVCCHILPETQIRSISVGHLDCLLRPMHSLSSHQDNNSLPDSSPPIPFGCTISSGHDQQLTGSCSRLTSGASRQDTFPVTHCLTTAIPSVNESRATSRVVEGVDKQSSATDQQVYTSSVWWLGEQTGGDASRKAVFSLSIQSDNECSQPREPSDMPHVDSLVSGRHLLLPGYSDFEDELTRDVAHFELSDFLISQLAYIDATALIPDEQQWIGAEESNRVTLPAERPCSLSFADPSKQKERPSSPRCSHSNLGFLVFNHSEQVEKKKRCYKDCPIEKTYPLKSMPLSVFSDLFGVIHQGVFVDPNSCANVGDNQLDNASPANPSTSREYLSSLSNGSSYISESTRSRLVVDLSTQVLNSCITTKLARNFKNLRQLLADTCDYDWAHQWCDIVSSYVQGMHCECDKPTHCASSSLPRYASGVPSGKPSSCRPCVFQLMPIHKASTVNNPKVFSSSSPTSQPSLRSMRFTADRSSYQMSPTPPFSIDGRTQLYRINYRVDPTVFSSANQKGTKSMNFNAICAPVAYSLFVNPPVEKSRRKLILVEQKNRCAGCGVFVESRYLKRMRFCEFFGKFFCRVCHSNELITLPGSVLTSWDFREQPVSSLARDRLTQMSYQPLLRLSDFNQRIVHGQSALHSCSTLRRQGNRILPFVCFCPDATQLLAQVNRLPSHWITSPDLWSLADLCATRDGDLARQLRSVLQPVVEHLSSCLRCQAQGYICEICRSGRILFPFGQANTVTCPTCMACFHRACLRNPRPDNCPRCVRRAMRRSRLRQRQVHQQKLMQTRLSLRRSVRLHEGRSNWQQQQQNYPSQQPYDCDFENEEYDLVNCSDQEIGETMPLNI